MAITISTPTIGGNEGSWGSVLNTQLTAIESTFNGSGTGKATVAPDLSTLTINGTNVSSSAAEINKLAGFTGTFEDLNYAKDLRATGVTSTEFDVLDGNTAATSTTVVGADRVVFNDNGTMKQVSMSDIATYTSAQISTPTVNNSTITFSAGSDMSGGGTITLNQSSNETVTFSHGNTSSLNGATSNSGSNYIQNITVDDNGHVTAISASDASSNISNTFTRGTTSQGVSTFTAAAGMYMVQIYSISTLQGGSFNLPTTNLNFGMINLIHGSTNQQTMRQQHFFYDGSDWKVQNGSVAQTALTITNTTTSGQQVTTAWGFLTFTGASTFTSTNNVRFNIIKVA